MIQTYIYIGLAFITGFITAWIVRSVKLNKLSKLQRSTQGYLESEKLMKETIQKENIMAHQMKQAAELDCGKKLQESQALIQVLDENILLLQKSNEETEALMKAGLPAMHELKLKLIDAHNTIARYKGHIEIK